MINLFSRRTFLKSAVLGSAGILGSLHLKQSFAFSSVIPPSELHVLCRKLLDEWSAALLDLQITNKSDLNYGGILCPADKIVHGRSGDAIYPFFHLAHHTNDNKYADAACLLYQWMEKHVSQDDGSWLNEPKKGSWKGTTVFAAIALAEAVKNHADAMDPKFKATVTGRLKKAGDFICNTFTIDYGNINYPISASYALSLLGTLLDISRYQEKGKDLAHQALGFITPQSFISGEGSPVPGSMSKKQYTVDVGYNVEESLPALVLYSLLTNDKEVLEAAIRSLKTHMEFMLPDGGWDNSWGTRNYKWTYWGSRTSDGCQAAYALMAGHDPRFYRVALKNLQLLQQCTKDGLLYGGPHYASHQIAPCVHHTFTHIKSLTTVLDYNLSSQAADHSPGVKNTLIPREENYGIRLFDDIQTCLVSTGKFKATVTAYNREYKNTRNGHASGGALTMLWHKDAGPLLSASMNEYQLYEADNMQADNDTFSMPLTPRIELKDGNSSYMNICDLNASIETETRQGKYIINTRSKLVGKDQQNSPYGEIKCKISYCFTDTKVYLDFNYDIPADTFLRKDQIRIILPLIASSAEQLTRIDDRTLQLHKTGSIVRIAANNPVSILPTSNGRIFNYVPGFEAVPLYVEGNNTHITIEVIS